MVMQAQLEQALTEITRHLMTMCFLIPKKIREIRKHINLRIFLIYFLERNIVCATFIKDQKL